jgi:thioredoxin reductase
MVNQVKKYPKVKIKTGEKVVKISSTDNGFKVETDKDTYESKTVLISTGRSARKLGLTGEDELVGKGLSYCATCDGPFAKNKEVIIIGGGYAATEAALILEKLASQVTVVSLQEKLEGEAVVISKVEKSPNIKIVTNAKTEDFILSDGKIAGIKYQKAKTGEKGELKGEFVFVEIGQVPNSKSFADFLKLNESGEIETDPKTNMTSEKGIFASGDIASETAKQVIVAAGDGAKAAISINKYLQNNS